MFRIGTHYQAKGLFDPDLLCATHDKMLDAADDYGQRFLRSFETAGRLGVRGNAWRTSISDLLKPSCARCCSKERPATSPH